MHNYSDSPPVSHRGHDGGYSCPGRGGGGPGRGGGGGGYRGSTGYNYNQRGGGYHGDWEYGGEEDFGGRRGYGGGGRYNPTFYSREEDVVDATHHRNMPPFGYTQNMESLNGRSRGVPTVAGNFGDGSARPPRPTSPSDDSNEHAGKTSEEERTQTE